MRLACSTKGFPQDRPEIRIAKVAWAGYQAVELALAADEPPPPADLFRRSLLADELEVAAVRAGTLPAEPGDLEALTRAGLGARLARELDSALVVLDAPAGGDPAGLAQALERLDRALGGLGVDVALVNRAGSLLASPAGFAELWALALPPRVTIALDPAQAALAGWDPWDLDALPQLPRHVYLCDAGNGQVVPPGDGTVDFDALARELRLRGYSGWLTLLLENAEPWQVEPVARELHDWAASTFQEAGL
jgi:sugar phosphate isomerase/epimerase